MLSAAETNLIKCIQRVKGEMSSQKFIIVMRQKKILIYKHK